MDSYLFLWKATMQYHVVCERCIKIHKTWWPKEKMVGIWKTRPNSFEGFSQKCFVSDCQRRLTEGADMEVFPRTITVLTTTSPYCNAYEGMEIITLPEPNAIQIANSCWEVLE